MLLLASLAEGPKHGYALTKDIEEFAGVHLAPGTLYAELDRLVELGLAGLLTLLIAVRTVRRGAGRRGSHPRWRCRGRSHIEVAVEDDAAPVEVRIALVEVFDARSGSMVMSTRGGASSRAGPVSSAVWSIVESPVARPRRLASSPSD